MDINELRAALRNIKYRKAGYIEGRNFAQWWWRRYLNEEEHIKYTYPASVHRYYYEEDLLDMNDEELMLLWALYKMGAKQD